MALSLRGCCTATSAAKCGNRGLISSRVSPVCKPRRVSCRAAGWQELIAAAGDVDAPIGVVVGGAVVVTLVATAILPLVLNPGQQAADKIFSAKQQKPLDKKPIGKKKGK